MMEEETGMAAPPELQQDAVLRFLAERGGRARNADLLDHFRAFLNSPDPERRARARERFKGMVNAVAIVKQEPGAGAKFVQLRKKFRGGPAGPKDDDEAVAAAAADPEPAAPGQERGDGDAAPEARREAGGGQGARAGGYPAAQSEPEAAPSSSSPDAGDAEQQQQQPPGRQAGEEAPPEDSSPSLAAPPVLGALPLAAAATPLGGRKTFRERRMGASPQLKRGGGGGFPRAGVGGGGRERDSDSASLASSSAEEESSCGSTGVGGGSVALDPLEHAWMLCASDGRWESLEGLLGCEPALLTKRDFITGFTCLHWAAKHGRHELLALLVNFAHRHRLPVNINARTSCGYTALHLAAMHGHLEVLKLLVGAYDADVDVRDYSGRKAAHYLSRGTAEEVLNLVGALQDEADGGPANGGSRWRLSKVLPANLIGCKLSQLHHGGGGEEGDAADGSAGQGKGKELSRKSSGSGRLKPRLNKIRFRTQIIHTTPSFRGDPEEEEGQEEKPLKSSFKLRPKSNVFG
ncbi:ankyrin repeat domain-containing protein SOWAHC [Paroedura picta]|uniref:ankyrin repeat domain-containing protein SOWAHC n=1 Tax=Paroedura picta TaxID=143630 RepID=UPI0040563283